MMVYHLLATKAPLKEIIFTDTGLETDETYDFIKAVDKDIKAKYDREITSLRFLTRHPYAEEVPLSDLCVQFDTFEKFYEQNGIPTRVNRTCTDQMKIRTSLRWLMTQHQVKAEEITQYLGIRGDEGHRVERRRISNTKKREILEMPLAERKAAGIKRLPPMHYRSHDAFPLHAAGVSRDDVLTFWAEKQKDMDLPFDVADPELRLSNCVGCMFSSEKALVKNWKRYPKHMAYWAMLEQRRGRPVLLPHQLAKREARAQNLLVQWKREYNKEYPGDENLLGRWQRVPKPLFASRYMKETTLPGLEEQDEITYGGCGDSGICGVDI